MQGRKLRKLNHTTPSKKFLKPQQDELAAIRTLYELSMRPVTQDNLSEIMQQVLDAAITFSGADMGNIQLFDAGSSALKIIVHRGFQRPFLDFFATVYPEVGGCGASCGASFAQMQRVIVEDVAKSPIFAGTPALSAMLAAEALACQSTPLLSHGNLVGMLNTHFHNPLCKDDLDLRYVDLLASQAANIIVQVRAEAELRESEEKYRHLSEELRKHRDNLEKIVEERTTEILRLDRLNTVGEMAAAIGHEVRNPMTTVRGYLQMMQRKKEYAEHREQFKTMIEEIDRANGIISDFLSLAKNKAVEQRPYNINDVVSALLPLLQAEALRIGHDLNIEMGDVADFTMDEKEIRQLLLNLANNAFQAMEPGGRLTIATCATKDEIILSVCDTGKGIPEELLTKLGTPFLTTKENGTGLGLPVCYRIAERHGAKIDIQTSEAGTTFIISFPM